MASTKYTYAVLTFIFHDYDLVRTPSTVVDGVEYVLVSDHYFEHPVWHVVVDESLTDKDTIFQSYYVRYNPFKYVHSDICIVIDASVQIVSDLSILVDDFNRTGRDMTVMCTNYLTIDQQIERWRTEHNLDDTSIANIKQLQSELGAENLLGGLCNAFKICRNNVPTRNFHLVVWGYLVSCGINGTPNRLDTIVEHMVLNAFFLHLKLNLVSTQLLHSSLMKHYHHNIDSERNQPSDYDEFFYLCNRPVRPKRYGSERIYPTTYKYKTEAMLLTKYLNEADMDEWLDWHLNKCGFEHIQVFANDLPFNVDEYAAKYDTDKVTFTKISGIPRQYKIYNDYISNHSQANWIMPIDDDEYLSLSPEFHTVYDAICYYERKFPQLNMLAIRWKHMFPKKFQTERTGKVLDYCTEENKELAVTFKSSGDRTIKTIVRRYGHIYYQEASERHLGGHVPKHSGSYAAITFDGARVRNTALNKYPIDTADEKIRLLHCRYTGPHYWQEKYNNPDPTRNCLRISNFTHKPKQFIFNDLLPYLE